VIRGWTQSNSRKNLDSETRPTAVELLTLATRLRLYSVLLLKYREIPVENWNFLTPRLAPMCTPCTTPPTVNCTVPVLPPAESLWVYRPPHMSGNVLDWLPFTLKNCPFPLYVGNWTPSNTWFLGPTQIHSPNGISIGSSHLQGSQFMTDRQTDHATVCCSKRLQEANAAMWPKNGALKWSNSYNHSHNSASTGCRQ